MKLLNKKGIEIPYVGLGTYPFQGNEMAEIILKALKVGYRLFDTADDYRGEAGIGLGLKHLDGLNLTREDLFLQTKISDNNAYADEPLKGIYFNPNSKIMYNHSVDEIVREKVANSLSDLNTDYLDSLLIHYPFPDYITEIWKTMIKLKEEGVVRYIGVSNFHECHIDCLIQETGVCPDINEIYLSPIGIKQSLVDYCNAKGCKLMTYSPLMDIAAQRVPIEKIEHIMRKYNKSAAQIVLRWNVERGSIPLPKSKNINRLIENFDIFDFKLSQDEVSEISSLNFDFQYLVESKICPGI